MNSWVLSSLMCLCNCFLMNILCWWISDSFCMSLVFFMLMIFLFAGNYSMKDDLKHLIVLWICLRNFIWACELIFSYESWARPSPPFNMIGPRAFGFFDGFPGIYFHSPTWSMSLKFKRGTCFSRFIFFIRWILFMDFHECFSMSLKFKWGMYTFEFRLLNLISNI